MSKRIEKLIERNENVRAKAEVKVMDNNNKMIDKIISEVFSRVEELKMLNAVDRLEEAFKLNIEAVKTNTVEVPVVRILKEAKKPEVVVVEKERPIVRVFRDKTVVEPQVKVVTVDVVKTEYKEVERVVYTTFRQAKQKATEVKPKTQEVKQKIEQEVKAVKEEVKVISENKYIEPLTVDEKTYRVVSSFEDDEYIAGIIRADKTDIRFQASKVMDAITIFDARYIKQEDAIRQLLIKNKMIRLNVAKLDEYKYQNSNGSCHFHTNKLGEQMYQGYVNINGTKYLYKYSYQKDANVSIAFVKLNDWFAKQGKIKFYPYSSAAFVNPVHALINKRTEFAKKAKAEKTKSINAELSKEFAGMKNKMKASLSATPITNNVASNSKSPITIANTLDTNNTKSHDYIATQRAKDFITGDFGLSEQEEQKVLDCGLF